MSSRADTNPAGWTDEEWAGMLRDAEAEVDSLKAENQRLREALERIAAESHPKTTLSFKESIEVARDALAAVGEE